VDWIGLDLTSGTLDEKHECMGYDSIHEIVFAGGDVEILDSSIVIDTSISH
jgi:hypothetical protein